LNLKAEDVLRELGRIGFSNVADFIEIDGNGNPRLDLSGATRDKLAAVASIVVDEFTDGRGDDARPVRRVRCKMYDKLKALLALGEHLRISNSNSGDNDFHLTFKLVGPHDEEDED
jgi:phage terminase small subunit